ncbi:acyl-CoA synthetase family protein [Halorussus halophilus]|uniref:hypothetical protein n=1 Tax=Halorussus halophilus TaxID=2650975 RepID=UPI0013010592|nr:hypothetical protein [Halorussus halophilus]
METLGDLVARERRSDEVAVVTHDGRSYDYHRFCTTTWKTGNFFRRLGVHEEATVAVADDHAPEVLFSFLGAAMLSAETQFGPERETNARVVVAPVESAESYDLPAGGQRVAYGGPPDDPAVAHFERDVWSENPTFPETPLDSETVALVGDEREFTHAELLSGAREIADEWDLESDERVAVRDSLAKPGTVVAGVLAPLLAGATVLFPGDEETGDFAVGTDTAPERRTIRAKDVLND